MLRVVRYGVVRQAHSNPVTQCDDIIVVLEDRSVVRESHHPSYHWPNSERFKDAVCVSRESILLDEHKYLMRSFDDQS